MNDPESYTSPRGLDRFFSLLARLPISDRLFVHTLFAIVIASGLWFVLSVNDNAAEAVPVTGGAVVEGIIGVPRFINPTLATTRADRDLSALIYDGVLTLDETGELELQLADAVDINDDGTVYTISLRDDVTFHDGTPLTAADVVFTYQLMQDPDLKSPQRGNWNTVTINQLGEYQLELELAEPYAPFMENLTTGIMPKHIWEDITAAEIPFHRLNIEPIGSGPYKIGTINRTDSGAIAGYTLEAHSGAVAHSYLDTVEIRFFAREPDLRAALRDETITSTADIATARLHEFDTEQYHIVTAPLPRVFGIFFNQNRNPALRNQAARQALSLSIDREAIVSHATHNYGVPTTLSVPPHFSAIESVDVSPHPTLTADHEAARELLEDDGWELNDDGLWERSMDDETAILSVTLRTPVAGMYSDAADAIVENWEALGVEVRLEQYEQSDLLDGIIRPREFEAVLFGMDVGHSVDLYPFWHSSQQADPGLNIAQFTSISTDRRLTRLRQPGDEAELLETKQTVVETLAEEVPALFLFSPQVTHVVRSDVQITDMPRLTDTSDRLKALTSWHRETATLWPIFHTHPAVITDI